MIDKFPLLARWNTLEETWADLMWLESEAIVATMLELMEKGVPTLPIHDASWYRPLRQTWLKRH